MKTRKILSAILALALVCTLLPGLTIGAKAADPTIINNYDELEEFAASVNDGTEITAGKCYKLADNFGKGSGNAEKLTTPIGNLENAFKGSFDGNGQTVTVALDGNSPAVGMFASLDANGVVENVTVAGSVKSNAESGEVKAVGAVVGCNAGTVKNCASTATVTSTKMGVHVGGVVGYNAAVTGKVIGCSHSTGVVTAEAYGCYAGGVVGSNYGLVDGCCNTADVTCSDAAFDYIGGVVGVNWQTGTVVNSAFTDGKVSVTSVSIPNGLSGVGGVVSSNYNLVVNCYASGSVSLTSGSSWAGGVVGSNGGENAATLANCYAVTVVTASGDNTASGGVIGKNSTGCSVNCCYSLVAPVGLDEGTSVGCEQMDAETMKAVSGVEGALVDKLNTVAKGADFRKLNCNTWLANGKIYPIFDYQGEVFPVTARLDGMEDFPAENSLNLSSQTLESYCIEKAENGYYVKYGDSYLKLDASRKITTVQTAEEATLWQYNGGLYTLVATDKRSHGSFFRVSHTVRYYLAATTYGNIYARLLFAPAAVVYETHVIADDMVTLTYADSTSHVGFFGKRAYDFTITAPEGAEISYSAGLTCGMGDSFTMLYRPYKVRITVTIGEDEAAVTTIWLATLTKTGYVMSLAE